MAPSTSPGRLGVSETIIGLTLVALGTSMPELVTTIVAAYRKEADVALGNILGSCIFNVLGILGVTALVRRLPVPAEIAAFDIWVLAATTVALVVFAITDWRLGRREGFVLLAGYGVYLAAQLSPGLRTAIGIP